MQILKARTTTTSEHIDHQRKTCRRLRLHLRDSHDVDEFYVSNNIRRLTACFSPVYVNRGRVSTDVYMIPRGIAKITGYRKADSSALARDTAVVSNRQSWEHPYSRNMTAFQGS
jgi:hypothetical protein